MKNSKWLLLIILILLTITSCDKKEIKETKTYSEDISKVVNRITKGSIKSDSKIEVWFNDDIVTDDELNKNIEEKIFSFNPEIKGKTYWQTPYRLVFEPEEKLENWEKYQGNLELNKLSENLKNLETLKFAFNIVGLDIFSFNSELKLKDKSNPKELYYKGKIEFTEPVNSDNFKEAIILENGSKNYELEIFPEPDKKTFTFISEDIIRDNTTKDFKLKINKDDLNLEEEFVKEFQVTNLDKMKIVKVSVEEKGKNPKIRIEFSDEVDFDQNLSGLVHIKNIQDMKIQKNGSSLILDGGFYYGRSYNLVIESGLRSIWGTKTEEKEIKRVKFNDILPQIYFASDGIILPEENEFKLQFYSSNLKRVHVEIKKVYSNSLSEFVRSERLTSTADRKTPFTKSYINRVGVIIHNETFEISDDKNKLLLNEIDLSNVVSKDKKGLYLVRLNFNPRDMLVSPQSDKLNYIEREGQIYKPIFFSNFGLTCKRSDNDLTIFATDLKTGKPLKGVKIYLKEKYRNSKSLDEAVTDSDGRAELTTERYFYNNYIEAEYNGYQSVLKFNESEWNISGFDISGVNEEKNNIKSYVYTERGVYRPGDEINLCAIVRSSKKKQPDNLPARLELYNPNGTKEYELKNKKNNDGFYSFKINTKQTDPTGSWNARLYVGGSTFYHTIKIETVVPYKLKVKVEPKHKKILPNHKFLESNIICNYLFGNPGSNLDAELEVEINAVNKKFNNYSKFRFSNPLYNFEKIQKQIFKGKLSKDGNKDIKWPLPNFTNIPSGLVIKQTATVFEKGGRPNKNWIYTPLEPYKYFVGIESPRYSYVATGSDMKLPVILVNSDGKSVSGKTLKFKIYKNEKHWWWYYDRSKKIKFKSDNNTLLVKQGEITTGKHHSILSYVPIDRGSYFIEVTDASGTGHSSGVFLNAYPYGSSPGGDKNSGTLALTADKEKYYVGEKALVSFPAPNEGSVLVTVEKYNTVLSQKWYYPDGSKEMKIEIPVTKQMVPNAYVSISLIQPHAQTVNDRPIRMFGILPLNVIDKETKHHIEIKTAAQFRPDEEFEIELQSTDQKETQFTVAVVDEGLLDITQFKTPDPWKYFYKKIRLGVLTYDIYSHIISANIGDVFKTFSIGGGLDYRESQLEPKKGNKRFKPVSMFKGPIKTDKFGNAKVKFNMPNYLGSVRIMVIGANENSYARSEKTVPVKTEIVTLPTIPRKLGPNEKFKVPVTVFAMKENLGKVDVKIKTEGPIDVVGGSVKNMQFTGLDEKDCYFELKSKKSVGQGKISIIATNGVFTTKSDVDIMVNPTSARIYKTIEKSVEKGEEVKITIPDDGIAGTNKASLNISSIPNLNFKHRLNWLIRYPYGCIEQTTSSVFPQLYIKKFINYPSDYAQEIDENIMAGIKRLRSFKLYSGSFSYWPHGTEVSKWGTLYAGHFLIEAKKLGYTVPDDLFNGWLNYTRREARNHYGKIMFRVYRSYILALNNSAELSEMNALKESYLSKMNDVQRWLLAASYKLAGLPDDAEAIIKNIGTNVEEYKGFSESYGSRLRDAAMILDAMVVLEKYKAAEDLIKQISNQVATRNWYSTQSLGYSLLSIGKYVTKVYGNANSTKMMGEVELPDGRKIPFDTDRALTFDLNKYCGEEIKISVNNNTTVKIINATMTWSGVPLEDNTKTAQNNLELKVEWLDENGNSIDPKNIKQGSTFYGHFSAKNISLLNRVTELALVQVLPSGWEIVNTRLLNESLPEWTEDFNLNWEEYLDIRDDRIMWFFDFNDRKKTLDFVVKLNAVTVGEFKLPGTILEAMYNGTYKATKSGYNVKVTDR